MTLGIGLAATNTGNNLLFLSLGMLLSIIILSGVLSEAAVGRIWLGRIAPKEARAGEPVMVEIAVRNDNRFLPSLGLVLVEVGAENVDAAPARCVRVDAGKTMHARMRLTPRVRGEVRLSRLRVTTSYPFGIFAKSREVNVPGTFVAWPGRVLASASARRSGRGESGAVRFQRGGGEDLHGLRGWREGDEARQIHWRRSLRLGELVVVEREAPQGRTVRLVLEAGEGEAFEAAVRIAAAQVEAHLSAGDEVALTTPEERIEPGSGTGHRHRLLTHLALVRARGARVAAA